MIANGLEDDLAGRNYAKKREAITVWVLEMFDGRKGWTAIQAFAFSAPRGSYVNVAKTSPRQRTRNATTADKSHTARLRKR